jgi:hypothetical protein
VAAVAAAEDGVTLFERTMHRAATLAARRAEARADELAGRMQDELPAGIAAERTAEGVRLSGRDLRRRLALDPGLRWLVERFR